MNMYLEMLSDDDRGLVTKPLITAKAEKSNTETPICTNDKTDKSTSVSYLNKGFHKKEFMKRVDSWLDEIGETDLIKREDAKSNYFADDKFSTFVDEEVARLRLYDFLSDDRRSCSQCKSLTKSGICTAVRDGQLNLTHPYRPIKEIKHRCIGYKPNASDSDQRSASDRWPFLPRFVKQTEK